MKFVHAGYSVDERQDIIKGFQEDPGFEDLNSDILVLPCGLFNKGYTMTRAKKIILMDITWLDDIEDQAVKRIHRIGSLNATHASVWYTNVPIDMITFGIQEKRRQGREGTVRSQGDHDALVRKLAAAKEQKRKDEENQSYA